MSLIGAGTIGYQVLSQRIYCPPSVASSQLSSADLLLKGFHLIYLAAPRSRNRGITLLLHLGISAEYVVLSFLSLPLLTDYGTLIVFTHLPTIPPLHIFSLEQFMSSKLNHIIFCGAFSPSHVLGGKLPSLLTLCDLQPREVD